MRVGFVPVEGRPVAVRRVLSWMDLRAVSQVRGGGGAMHFWGGGSLGVGVDWILR